jgi:alanine dehydrogenase
MIIGIPKEAQPGEKRVMLLPEEVKQLVQAGHIVYVEFDAAEGIRISNEEYSAVGARIAKREVVYQSDLVVQLKRPEAETFDLLKDNLLFCMGHSEDEPDLLPRLSIRNVTLIEMEKILDSVGERVVNQCSLTGEVAVHMVLQYLDTLPVDTKVIVIGQGNVAQGALKACNKLGMNTQLLRRAHLDQLPAFLSTADLLINGIPWTPEEKRSPHYLLTREQLRDTPKHLVILDLICAEPPNPIQTLRPTFYNDPYYEEEGRKHISLWGYPGLVPVSSARIYSKQVLPIVQLIAETSWQENSQLQPAIRKP